MSEPALVSDSDTDDEASVVSSEDTEDEGSSVVSAEVSEDTEVSEDAGSVEPGSIEHPDRDARASDRITHKDLFIVNTSLSDIIIQ